MSNQLRIMRQPFTSCLVLLVLLGGCASLPPLPEAPQRQALPASMPRPMNTAYVIGPEDRLKITVYGHPDLSIEVVVSAEGVFAYPDLGTIMAAGFTAQQVETVLKKRLKAILVDPQVSVTVTQFQSQQVYVLGEVRTPGVYVLKRATMLRELLSQAGGPTPDAGWEVLVMRPTSVPKEGGQRNDFIPLQDGETTLRMDVEQLLSGQILQPVMVQGGDTVYLPAAMFFYVSGEIKRPGRYRLERDTTVTKALTVAGGMTTFAAKTRLKVRRLVKGQRQEFHVSLTDVLQPEDVLIVPESVF